MEKEKPLSHKKSIHSQNPKFDSEEILHKGKWRRMNSKKYLDEKGEIFREIETYEPIEVGNKNENDRIIVSITVENCSDIDAKEIVQLYIQDLFGRGLIGHLFLIKPSIAFETVLN